MSWISVKSLETAIIPVSLFPLSSKPELQSNLLGQEQTRLDKFCSDNSHLTSHPHNQEQQYGQSSHLKYWETPVQLFQVPQVSSPTTSTPTSTSVFSLRQTLSWVSRKNSKALLSSALAPLSTSAPESCPRHPFHSFLSWFLIWSDNNMQCIFFLMLLQAWDYIQVHTVISNESS